MARKPANRTDVTIDKAGRVVIPNGLRRQLGVRAGTRLAVSVEGQRLVLEPIEETDAIVERNGILIATGSLAGEWDHRDLRDERARRHGGW